MEDIDEFEQQWNEMYNRGYREFCISTNGGWSEGGSERAGFYYMKTLVIVKYKFLTHESEHIPADMWCPSGDHVQLIAADGSNIVVTVKNISKIMYKEG